MSLVPLSQEDRMMKGVYWLGSPSSYRIPHVRNSDSRGNDLLVR